MNVTTKRWGTLLSRFDDALRPGRPLVVILGDDTDEEDHDLLFPALRARNTSVVRLHPFELTVSMSNGVISFSVAGQAIEPDLVVGWVLGDLLLPGMAHLEAFEAAGIPVINNAFTLFRAQNKYVTSTLLAANGILNYSVLSGCEPGILEEWVEKLDGSAVLKPLSGFGGRGLSRVRGREELSEVLSNVDKGDRAFYAMPWIDNPGHDIRVYTVNYQPIFAMYRYAPPGQWITNVLAGGGISMCPLTDEISSLASQASRAAGTLIGGVDVGENQQTGELVVYEVNSCPTCEPPVLEAVADFLAAAARDLDSALRSWRPTKIYDQLDEDPTLFHPSKNEMIRDQT